MGYLLAVLLGYTLGCSSMAFYIGKWKHRDIRSAGSGNLGASNATVLFGWGAGVAVALHDIGKGVLAVWLANRLFPQLEYAGAAAGVACVLGHIYPVWLGFRGGKGLAAYFGMTLAINWRLAAFLVVPVYMGLTTHNRLLTGILGIASAVMLLKHWENLVRIAKGQEIGLCSTARGENRVDRHR